MNLHLIHPEDIVILKDQKSLIELYDLYKNYWYLYYLKIIII
jgi:hypothetical protein